MAVQDLRKIPVQQQLAPPFQDSISDSKGSLTSAWISFFSLVSNYLTPLGTEKYFDLPNGKTALLNDERDYVLGLRCSKESFSQAFIEYLIQRVTTESSAGANDDVELTETGTMTMLYKPSSDLWILSGGPTSTGIALTAKADGQIVFTSTLITGTPLISKISWRMRTIAAKHHSYSRFTRR